MAQLIFAAIYLCTLAIVLRIYTRSAKRILPPWSLGLLSLSKRLHSIYLLRLFNDGVTMLPLYAAIAFAIEHRWRPASLLFSLALSVKMNILLFTPAFALLMLLDVGLIDCLWNGVLIVAVQVRLSARKTV